MRNVFDQYKQPENRLTHALVSTLDSDRTLLRPFLRSIGVHDAPPASRLRIVEQQLPGARVSGADEERGLPDACIFDDDGFAVLIESKVQARVSARQLRLHLKTAARVGYGNSRVVVLAVDERLPVGVPPGTASVTWRDLYSWFSSRSGSAWAARLVDYMRVFESRMIAEEYVIRGTLTMFDGFRFDRENPYTYAEGKRLLRLTCDELRRRPELRRIGIDPTGAGRTAITGRDEERVWDFIPLKEARDATQATHHPHVTLGVTRGFASVAVTVPNGVKGGFRTRLADNGVDGFHAFIEKLEESVRPVVRSSKGAKPVLYVVQRHYRSQRAVPQVDATLDVDLRTICGDERSGVKRQPEWFAAIHNVLVNKRSNVQLGAQLRFSYDCPIVQSKAAVSLFTRGAVALEPLLKLARG